MRQKQASIYQLELAPHLRHHQSLQLVRAAVWYTSHIFRAEKLCNSWQTAKYATLSLCAYLAGKEALTGAPAETGPKQYRAAAFDTPDAENPKKIGPAPETEAEFTRYQRQRTVSNADAFDCAACCFRYFFTLKKRI